MSEQAQLGNDSDNCAIRSSEKNGEPFAFENATLISVLLAGVTLAVFWPVVHYDGINLDDQIYVFENPLVLGGLSWDRLRWAFTNLQAGFWHPLTWLSYMLDSQLFGNNAGGFHFTNLFLHTANSVLVFSLLKRFTGAIWRSAFVAALFALHPLHVEAVVWISSRKDVLSTFFGLLTLLCYGCYAQKNGHVSNDRSRALACYGMALLFFVLSLMSKSMLVTLPIVMLLLDYWPLRRFEIASLDAQKPALLRMLAEKAPFIAAAAIFSTVTFRAEKGMGSLGSAELYPLFARVANACLSCAWYLVKTFWPFDLAVYYPYPKSFSVWFVVISTLAVLVMTSIAIQTIRQRPHLAVGWLWYLVTVLPVLGLIQVGDHSHADRYTYVPLIGIFIILAWELNDVFGRLRLSKAVAGLFAVLVLGACAVRTMDQLQHWENSEKLFRHTLAVAGPSVRAYYCLGAYLLRAGNVDEAIGHLRKAHELAPSDTEVLNNLGVALGLKGELDEAVKQFHEAIRNDPNNVKAYINLGNAMLHQGRPEEAVTNYSEAIRRQTNLSDAHFNLALAMLQLDRRDDARIHLLETLRIKPDCEEARQQLQALDAQLLQ